MKYNLYTVYDKVGEEAGSPFICRTDGIAMRQFVFAFKQSNRPELKLEDHILYRVGTFDNETMKVEGMDNLVRVNITGLDVEVVNEPQTV